MTNLARSCKLLGEENIYKFFKLTFELIGYLNCSDINFYHSDYKKYFIRWLEEKGKLTEWVSAHSRLGGSHAMVGPYPKSGIKSLVTFRQHPSIMDFYRFEMPQLRQSQEMFILGSNVSLRSDVLLFYLII